MSEQAEHLSDIPASLWTGLPLAIFASPLASDSGSETYMFQI